MKKLLPGFHRPEYADGWIFLCARTLLSVFIIGEILSYARIEPFFRVLLILFICSIFYIGGYLKMERLHDAAPLYRCFGLFFVLYLYILLTFTLIYPSMGRVGNSIYWELGGSRQEYLSRFFNPVPFRSIYHVYLRGFFLGYVNGYYTFLNLIGNIFAFMPFAFFLPYHFPAMGKWRLFLPFQILAVLLIEALQFLFMVGSCDIDDLILNAGGAALCFALLKTPALHRIAVRFGKKELFPKKKA